MEKSTPIKCFMELANFDQSLNGLRHNINSIKLECDALKKALTDLQENVDTSKQQLLHTQKSVHNHELIMQELESNLQKQKNLLDTVTNQKEYNAVKSSINQIKQDQHNYESILIDEWHKLDLAKNLFETKKEKLAQEILNTEASILEKKSKLAQLEADLLNQNQQRIQFMTNLPPEWLERYEAMYTKVNNPIVQLLDNACGACYQEVTSQVINELKHQKLIQCKGCFRFLFFQKG